METKTKRKYKQRVRGVVKLSAEHKARISASRRGHKWTPEQRAASSASHKGKSVSAVTKSKLSALLSASPPCVVECCFVSPDNKVYHCRNVTKFVLEHRELFTEEQLVRASRTGRGGGTRASQGLLSIRRNFLGRKGAMGASWYGWTVREWRASVGNDEAAADGT